MTAPGEFAGRFQSPGDSDYYTFHADAGQVFYIDVFADRIGSLADPYLVVEQVGRDAKGAETVTRMTSIDDENTNVAPAVFDTRSDDPIYRFQAPETGMYRILLRDRSFESRGDPRLVYHVSIRPEEPDFRLVVLPQYPKQGSIKEVSTWALGLRKGDSRDVPILVLRRDGFREPIEVWAEGLPQGVTCRGAAITPYAKTAELIFTVDEKAAAGDQFIRVFGKARVTKKGRTKDATTETEIVREAIPATIVWSAEADASAVSRIAQSLAPLCHERTGSVSAFHQRCSRRSQSKPADSASALRRASERFRRRRGDGAGRRESRYARPDVEVVPQGQVYGTCALLHPSRRTAGLCHAVLEVAGSRRLSTQSRGIRASQSRTSRGRERRRDARRELEEAPRPNSIRHRKHKNKKPRRWRRRKARLTAAAEIAPSHTQVGER